MRHLALRRYVFRRNLSTYELFKRIKFNLEEIATLQALVQDAADASADPDEHELADLGISREDSIEYSNYLLGIYDKLS